MAVMVTNFNFIMASINMDDIVDFIWSRRVNIFELLFSLFSVHQLLFEYWQIFFKALYVFFTVAESHAKRFVGGFHSVVYGRVQPQPKNTTSAPLAPGDAVSVEMMLA